MRIFKSLMLFILVTGSSCFRDDISSTGVLGKIKDGFKLAGKLFGLDEPEDLTQMVSETFSGKFSKKSDDVNNDKANMFSGFLRLLGLDTKKLSAIAVNAIIFVAQLISTTLSKPHPSKLNEARKIEGTPLEWLLNTSKITGMLDSVKDSNLPNNVVEYIKESGLDEDTDCIQLLICKTAPLIWGMQKALNSTKNDSQKGVKALFEYLPTIQEFSDHSDVCEKKHQYCLIHY